MEGQEREEKSIAFQIAKLEKTFKFSGFFKANINPVKILLEVVA